MKRNALVWAEHTPAVKRQFRPCLWLVVAVLTGCTVGPDYHRPSVETPPAWSKQSSDGGRSTRPDADAGQWKQASPGHAPLSLDWWTGFQDPILNQLEARALTANQTLQEADAHYRAAHASLAITAAAALPEVGISSGLARNKTSGNRPVQSYGTPVQSTTQNDVTLKATVSYEVDLFGRVRREIEGAKAADTQAADDLANVRLIVTTDLATSYLSLRSSDDEIAVVQHSVDLQAHALQLVTAQHRLGTASRLDVLQQQTLLDDTSTQAQLLLAQRGRYEDAIASMIGTPAANFHIAPLPLSDSNDNTSLAGPGKTRLFDIPPALPSELLERRPDIASAERAMAEANARIGVAKSAYYPNLTLSPNIGWESTQFASMLSAPSLLWSLGATATQLVFDGGKRRAGVEFAQQEYRAQEAAYRQTVLTAFQEVQDAILSLTVLKDAAVKAQTRVEDSQQLLSLANRRYKGGATAFIDVIQAQLGTLQGERQAVQIRGQQAALTVYLAKALGGGWRSETLSNG